MTILKLMIIEKDEQQQKGSTMTCMEAISCKEIIPLRLIEL